MFAPVVLAIIVLLPRLMASQFGLLDDGVTIITARKIIANPSYLFNMMPSTGRFFPGYWLYGTLLYCIGGDSAFVYFLGNCILLMASTAFIIFLVRRWGGTRVQAAFSGLFFALSGPVIEAFYTLSKPEPLQVALLLAAIALTPFTSRDRPPGRRLVGAVAVTAVLAASFCTKETGAIMGPIALAWLLASLVFKAEQTGSMGRSERAVLLAACVAAGLIYLALRHASATAAVSAGGYTAGYRLEVDRLFGNLTAWSSWIFRDFPYLLVLAAYLLWEKLRKQNPGQGQLFVDAAIWMCGWLAVFLPWQAALEYYLLPFAAGCSIFCGVACGRLLHRLQTNPGYRGGWAVLAGVGLLLGMTQANNSTTARYQLMVDSVNARLIDALCTLPPQSPIRLNLPAPGEYLFELNIHLAELRRCPGLSADYLRFPVDAPQNGSPRYFVVSPFMSNQLSPFPRHAVYASGAQQWEEALRFFLGRSSGLLMEVGEEMRALDFGFHRLLCPFFPRLGLQCYVARPLLDTRVIRTGWRLYKVSPKKAPAGLAVFVSGVWRLQTAKGPTLSLRFGGPGEVPLTADFDGDSFTDLLVCNVPIGRWRCDTNADGRADFEFLLDGMAAGDVPVAGDWDGSGVASPGFFRPANALFQLFLRRGSRIEPYLTVQFGLAGDVPLAGDWNGDGRSGIGVYRPSSGEIFLKDDLAGDKPAQSFRVGRDITPVVADWTGSGFDSIVVVRNGCGELAPLCNCAPSNPPSPMRFEPAAGTPLGGRWPPR